MVDALADDLTLDMYAAQLRAEHRSAAEQAEALAARIEALVPHLTTRTQGRWPLAHRTLRALRVTLGDDHLSLLVQGGHVHYHAAHHVGGIDLSRQELTQEAWVARVRSGIERLAAPLNV